MGMCTGELLMLCAGEELAAGGSAKEPPCPLGGSLSCFLRGGITRSPQLAVSCPLPVLEIVLCLKRWRSKLLEMFVTGNGADAEGWGIWELPSCFAAASTSPLTAPSQEGSRLPDPHPAAFLAAVSPC